MVEEEKEAKEIIFFSFLSSSFATTKAEKGEKILFSEKREEATKELEELEKAENAEEVCDKVDG